MVCVLGNKLLTDCQVTAVIGDHDNKRIRGVGE